MSVNHLWGGVLRAMDTIVNETQSLLLWNLWPNSDFWGSDPFILLTIIEDPKEPIFLWVISIDIYNIRN